MKIKFIELTPFVGERSTYYSKTKDPDEWGSIRGIFRTGASLSTKFYKAMDIDKNFWGIEIHKLRHIITPSIDYEYVHEPTTSVSQLDQFDGIDSLDRGHKIIFGIDNKLQTKRNDQSVELLRVAVNTDFLLKEDRAPGGFNLIQSDIDFRPADWLTLYGLRVRSRGIWQPPARLPVWHCWQLGESSLECLVSRPPPFLLPAARLPRPQRLHPPYWFGSSSCSLEPERCRLPATSTGGTRPARRSSRFPAAPGQ